MPNSGARRGRAPIMIIKRGGREDMILFLRMPGSDFVLLAHACSNLVVGHIAATVVAANRRRRSDLGKFMIPRLRMMYKPRLRGVHG